MPDVEHQRGTANTSTGVAPGRPRGGHNRPPHYDVIRKRYVEGEGIERQADGHFVRRYLSFRELGKEFNLHHSQIHGWAQRDNWAQDREKFNVMVQERIATLEAEKAATARALETVDALALTDSYLRKFATALAENKIRVDSVADLDKITRLRAFLLTQKDPAANKGAAVSLDALQSKHEVHRKHMRALPAEVTGVLLPDTESGTENNEDGSPGAALDQLSGLG